MLTTVSDSLREALIRGTSITEVWHDEWNDGPENSMFDLYPAFSDYKRIRRGRKHYVFVPKARPNDVVINYYCSWVEADRRFAVLLIARRMTR